MRRALPILLLLALSSCARRKEVSLSYEGVTLKYDCGKFEPQAKTFEETRVLMLKSIDSTRRAYDEKDTALYRSLRAARELKDMRRLEELMVQDECKRQK